MAKKSIRYKTRVVYKKAKSGASKSFFKGPVGGMLAAGLYGGVRQKISNALAPVTARVPAGEISDEVVMLGVCFAGSKMLPKGFRAPAKVGMYIEAARIGEFVADRGLSGLMPNGSSQSVSNGNTIF